MSHSPRGGTGVDVESSMLEQHGVPAVAPRRRTGASLSLTKAKPVLQLLASRRYRSEIELIDLTPPPICWPSPRPGRKERGPKGCGSTRRTQARKSRTSHDVPRLHLLGIEEVALS